MNRMIIPIKTEKEIQMMQEGGKKLSWVFGQLKPLIKSGSNLLKIEQQANQLIKSIGAKPAFKQVANYHWATCLNVNDEIVHGIPKDYQLKANDVLNIDIGLYYRGFNTDMSSTFRVKTQPPKPNPQNNTVDEIDRFLATGKLALKEAQKQAKVGNRVGHISEKIQQIIELAGYNCARNLTGHGVGRLLHESPMIPCFLRGRIEETPLLQKGMTLAIEIIYTQGSPELITDNDGWTIRTKDGKISAVFEETIVISQKGYLVLTKVPF